jgi:hypothetical protein
VLSHRSQPRPDSLLAAPAFEALAPELRPLVADQVFVEFANATGSPGGLFRFSLLRAYTHNSRMPPARPVDCSVSR